MRGMLTQADLAELLQVSEWTIWSMRRRGELPPVIPLGSGRGIRWRAELIDAWLIDRERPAHEFDPVLCEQSQTAISSRKKSITKPATEVKKKRRGPRTKKERVEARK